MREHSVWSEPEAESDGAELLPMEVGVRRRQRTKRYIEVGPKRLSRSFCSAARMQQKEKELQIVFCNSLICLVSRAGIEPATY